MKMRLKKGNSADGVVCFFQRYLPVNNTPGYKKVAWNRSFDEFVCRKAFFRRNGR